MMTAERNLTLNGYQLRLPTFEGPLDVLLNLIEHNRLEISNLSLVTVTDGFLQYIREMQDPPPALLADFANVASRLIVLKSRAMLPRPDVIEPEEDLDDLAAQLREYQRAKQVAQLFREREQTGLRSYPRPLGVDLPAPRIVLVAPPVEQLRRALIRTINRRPVAPVQLAMKPLVSIGELLGRFRRRLSGARRPLTFRQLISSRDRDEVVGGFIAILAMWRRGEVEIEQHSLFGDITIAASDGLADIQ